MEALLTGLVPGLPEGLRERVLARAEGIPLYAVETVRMLLDRGALVQEGPVYTLTGAIEDLEVPETLQALIAARLDGLPPVERRVIQDAAVLGKTFTREALAALTGIGNGELDATLASLTRKEVLVVQADPIVVPPGTVATLTAAGVQMIAEKLEEPARDPRIEPLTVDDYPAMLELAILTKPGPFAARTPSLGEFWGIKEAGVLVAMAGERMRHAGLTELSGVCTHPSARGRGYGRILSAWVAWQIAARGETPYLHAYASNTGAIELYRKLGFVHNRAMHVAALSD